MKRLKNVESKNEQLLVAVKDQGERQLQTIKDQEERQLEAISSYGATNKSQKTEFHNDKNQEAKEIVDEINKISREKKYNKFVCFHSNGTPYDFNKFRDIEQLGNDMFNDHISIKQAKDEKDEMKEEMPKLENYNPTNEQKIKSKEGVFNNPQKLFDIRSKVIKAFEDVIFPLPKKNCIKSRLKKKKNKKKNKKQFLIE